jgi:hypothetical protein
MLRTFFRFPHWLENAWAGTELDHVETVILGAEPARGEARTQEPTSSDARFRQARTND